MSLMCKQQAALSDELTTAHTSTVTSHTVTVDGHSQRRAGPQSGTDVSLSQWWRPKGTLESEYWTHIHQVVTETQLCKSETAANDTATTTLCYDRAQRGGFLISVSSINS